MSEFAACWNDNCGSVIPDTSLYCDNCSSHGFSDFTQSNIRQGQSMQYGTTLQNVNFTDIYNGGTTLNVSPIPSHHATFRNATLNHTKNELTPPISPWASQSPPDASQYYGTLHSPFAGAPTQANPRQRNVLQSIAETAIRLPRRPQDQVRAGTQQDGTSSNQHSPVAPTIHQNIRYYIPRTTKDHPTVVRNITNFSCIKVFRARGKSTPTNNPLACGTCANANTTCIYRSLEIAPPFDYDCWDNGLAKIRSSQDLTFNNNHGISSYTVDLAINGAVANNFITLDTISVDLGILHRRGGLQTSFLNINNILDRMVSSSESTPNCHIQVLCRRFITCVNLVMRPDLSTIRVQLKYGQAARIIAVELLRTLALGCSSLWNEIDVELNRILTSPRTTHPLIGWLNEAAYGLGMVSKALSGFSMDTSETPKADVLDALDRLLASAKARLGLFHSQLQRYRGIGPMEFDHGAKPNVPNLPGIHVILRSTSQLYSDDEDKYLEQIRSFQTVLSTNTASPLTEPMEVDTVDMDNVEESISLKIHEQKALVSQARSVLESREAELTRLLAERSLVRRESWAVLPKVKVEDTSNRHSIPMAKLSSSTSDAQEVDLHRALTEGPIAQQGPSTHHSGLDIEHVSRFQTISETMSRPPSSTATLVGTRGNDSSEGSVHENLAPPAVKKRKRDSILHRLSLTSHHSSQMLDAPPTDPGVEQDVGGNIISRRWSKIVAKLEGPPLSIDRPVNNSRWSHPNRETKVDVKSLVAAINKRLSIGPNLSAPMPLTSSR